jgi:hypothetical protein
MPPREAPTRVDPSSGRWILLSAAAEAIEMGASAATARLADGLADGGTVALLLIVGGGGHIEGAAIGGLQSVGLAPWFPGRGRWLLVTLIIAGPSPLAPRWERSWGWRRVLFCADRYRIQCGG